ncbi:G-beta repeat-containing protein with WD domain [Cryptosporidium felis]|nr:G-beta repeat-containing protein with WD domain [Cryptosporidium felis]
MLESLEKVVLERLNFFSSEQGFVRGHSSTELGISKSTKTQLEYSNFQGKNNLKIKDRNDPRSFHLFEDKCEKNQESQRQIGSFQFKKEQINSPSLHKEYKTNLNWTPRFKLKRVISGHKGWVRSIDVDLSNHFFASGSSDKLIKFWDLESGILKLTLTGHVAAVRKVMFSERHPFLFSCSEDKTMKCWDLELNRIVRNYARHSSGIYCLDIHPLLEIITTGSRDGSIVLWDIRTREPIHIFKQHKAAISSLLMQQVEPQLISGSYDRTIRTWDIIAGKTNNVLTHHIKPIRALAKHPIHYSFLSASADNIKVWEGQNSTYMRDLSSPHSIINSIALMSQENNSVIVAGCDNGQLHFWDFESGEIYDTVQSFIQPGSIEAENSVLDCKFDKSESILITGECDKTIKIWNLSG